MEQELREKCDCTSKKKSKLAWANELIEKSRKTFEKKRPFVARNPKFSNKVEQKVVEECGRQKRERADSGDCSLADASTKKSRNAYPSEKEQPPQSKPSLISG